MSQQKKKGAVASRRKPVITVEKLSQALDLSGVWLHTGVTDHFPTFTRTTFKQYAFVGGRKVTVRGGYVHAYANKAGRIFSVDATLHRGVKPRTTANLISADQAIQLAATSFGCKDIIHTSELVLSGDDDRLELAYDIALWRSGSSHRTERFIVNATTGEVVKPTLAKPQAFFGLGLDYAGGRPSGAHLAAAGVRFVCRYVADGGRQLPQKLLTAAEARDLLAHGIQIVSNFESSGRMDGGYAQGRADAQRALANHFAAGGPPNPVIYFSCDYDAPPRDQGNINAYLTGASDVLGGPQFCGVYGGYWVVKRALDAGVCRFGWQTEAWSGGNVDPRISIMQQNSRGYMWVDGVPCDYDEARTDYIGQWGTPPLKQPTSAITRVWTPRPFEKESSHNHELVAAP